MCEMARLPTTSDVFNAVAEPQRRDIINLLARNEKSVNEIAQALNLKQPQTSKHLRVLKEVGLVTVREAGKQRLYSLNSTELKPIYNWVKSFEHLWHERFNRLDTYLEELQKKDQSHDE